MLLTSANNCDLLSFRSSFISLVLGKFRSVNQGLNDEGRCCEAPAQTLQKVPTLAATDWLLMRHASVTTSENKKLLKFQIHRKWSYYIPIDLKFYVEQFFINVLTS